MADYTRAMAEQLVADLYHGLLRRAPEPAALQHWVTSLLADGAATAIAQAIIDSDEYRAQSALRGAKPEHTALAAATLPPDQPLTIVDLGAQWLAGQPHVYQPWLDSPRPCRLIGFEPLPDKTLGVVPRAGLTVQLLPLFIGDGHSQQFHLNNDDATSSLLPLQTLVTRQLRGLDHLQTVQIETVQTTTLDSALADVDRIDLLKLDIQGFELQALQHGAAVLQRTNVVHCEVSFAEIYTGQARFSEVETWLRLQGFDFIDFHTCCHYPYVGSVATTPDRLGWADAIFFRTQPATTRDRLAQALAAQQLYQKYSLAEQLWPATFHPAV